MTTTSKATNIKWHEGEIDKQKREKILKQKGVILWFTGLSGSGKSTLAVGLESRLYDQGYLSYRLDGDNIRHGLNSDLGFSPQDRVENIRRIGEVSKLMADAGLIVMTSFISPYVKDRELVRKLVTPDEFVEIYVKCSVDACEKRDPKGLYKKARKGEIPEFTGVSAPYEEPQNPEIIVATDKLEGDINGAVDYLFQQLQIKKIIN
ncbi:MAG: adenylyl-sulfate kinase [Candidatus Kerfeldbacteria bacterium RIFOXYA2_FULL_38_24]|uniref:Adenylyl-sulfate kinase n=1 Tax=Candidatus Kerfeldbacteria bacterium RIFOXYB2_FULL_38_14 TaxID=1798547 RepID=A0A1G2BGP2_9BACT|nr:MAG: adenylyl-sulfate kinase [Candidatus Kerfeldbacteria bacterium RIFOXYA2_FULL_38_24]OGY88225.1 MAG: adenylyl-sulfate kinase [Candidatus Kerfeldbacteria bacterium RIFOXYB2_FULL_38_14]OGY89772.1 MAG: adenylyl-sulfate kinase [Candidatus Kerfeldbacteria bacterium RIFOXYC2_FULL_38_9]